MRFIQSLKADAIQRGQCDLSVAILTSSPYSITNQHFSWMSKREWCRTLPTQACIWHEQKNWRITERCSWIVTWLFWCREDYSQAREVSNIYFYWYNVIYHFSIHTILTYHLHLAIKLSINRLCINHFYVVHEDDSLFACSKGRPSKEARRIRLECPEVIQQDLAILRKSFLINAKSKMLVLISMATDEMIRLVSMYSDVWFMDTTAGRIGRTYFWYLNTQL